MKPTSTIDKLFEALQKSGKIRNMDAHQSSEHRKKIDNQLKDYELEKRLKMAKDKEDISRCTLSS